MMGRSAPRVADVTSTPKAVLEYTVLCSIAIFLASTSIRAEEFTRTSHYSVRMFSFGTFTIESRVGDITVEGWDYPRLEIDAEKLVRAGSQKKANALFQKINVALAGKDKKITLMTLYPPRRLWRPFRAESKLTVNYTIRMPYDSNIKLSCVDGDVTIHGLTGSEVVKVSYGDVEIDVPDPYRVRYFKAHTFLGYVQSDLHGMEEDSAGFSRGIFFTAGGDQDIDVDVRMGGVFVYAETP
ncbi:MAG: hypothetical protein ACRD2O_09410 [Terriglobia bacterium]